MGQAGGNSNQLLQLVALQWHQTWQQSAQEPQQTAVCVSPYARFGANSPGDRPGKFAHPRLAEREFHQQLVTGEGAGGAAGECHIATSAFMLQPVLSRGLPVGAGSSLWPLGGSASGGMVVPSWLCRSDCRGQSNSRWRQAEKMVQ